MEYLALDDLGLLLDADIDSAAERLRQRLGLAHLERVDLAAADRHKRYIRAQRLRCTKRSQETSAESMGEFELELNLSFDPKS